MKTSGPVASDNSRFQFENTFKPPPSDDGISSATFETIYPKNTLHMYPLNKREYSLQYPHQDNTRGINHTTPYSPPEIPIPVRPSAVNFKEPLLPPTPQNEKRTPRHSFEHTRERKSQARNSYEQAGALPLPDVAINTPRRLMTEPIYNAGATGRVSGEVPTGPTAPAAAPGYQPTAIAPGQTVLIPNGQGGYSTAIMDTNGQIRGVAQPAPDYTSNYQSVPPGAPRGYYNVDAKRSKDTQSVSLFQQKLESELVTHVMNTPLISFKARGMYRDAPADSRITITASFVVYLFEILCGIVLITLSLLLVSRDPGFADGIYRYMIADSVVSLVVSILFIMKIINFENRNGSFYCTVATIMKVVLFVMVTSTVIPADCPTSGDVCPLRRAVSAFTIVSTFLWEGDLVMFLTTLYISRLNLLNDINFDYSNRGIDQKFNGMQDEKRGQLATNPSGNENQPRPLERTMNPVTGQPDRYINPVTGETLKEYYLTDNGHMYEITPGTDMGDSYMFLVYPPS